ncbi:peptide chain release factor N(5)-glutamine methyltransferase [Kribbella sp. CA-293567]|uniref:peptide chain release factor N(5)-glutamine methyltransferase n=1 Tax=Kribbella sp. CA-293567 TaxID=3002436 RepID=UPI0022DDB2E6|nr:peptide chain release factor N(5)-glutamine methyltransferase [Kribbella sp. CA-293567]WBQ07401.1 peptide chain release factor N(5)-glutamine methyltransferase [Kribbella sp. CA-293567]
MSVRTLLAEATHQLAEAGVASPDYDAAELLAHVTGVRRMQLGLVKPTADQEAQYAALLARRAQREPLQHLTGTAAFRYRDLAVGPGVFVPRPETEVLVGWILDKLADIENPLVVDLCSGSGAIAGAVATERPDSTVHAVELSADACVWARRNLAGTGATLHEGDIDGCLPELDGQIDAVISNPPYIPLTAWESVTAEVRDHDPALALWSGDDGLDEIKIVAATAGRLLKPGGWFGCEHADVQGESAPAVFASTGLFTEVRDQLDLAGRHRFATGRRV